MKICLYYIMTVMIMLINAADTDKTCKQLPANKAHSLGLLQIDFYFFLQGTGDQTVQSPSHIVFAEREKNKTKQKKSANETSPLCSCSTQCCIRVMLEKELV